MLPRHHCVVSLYLHGVGVTEAVLVAVVELLHLAEGLEAEVHGVAVPLPGPRQPEPGVEQRGLAGDDLGAAPAAPALEAGPGLHTPAAAAASHGHQWSLELHCCCRGMTR